MNFLFDTDTDFWLLDSGFHFHAVSLLLSTHDQDFLKRSGLFPQTRLVPDMKKKHTLQRQNTEISKQIFPEKEFRGLSPNFHIHRL
jgi:hypothetical protein